MENTPFLGVARVAAIGAPASCVGARTAYRLGCFDPLRVETTRAGRLPYEAVHLRPGAKDETCLGSFLRWIAGLGRAETS